ncbi:hypothetical protein NY78_2647 [Desulfovibrio sp. TomC]|nr:hypothetical protein NY78_2647 [Desulfovibrio sp. TomC]
MTEPIFFARMPLAFRGNVFRYFPANRWHSPRSSASSRSI